MKQYVSRFKNLTHLPFAVRRPSMAMSTPWRASAIVSPWKGAGANPSGELTSAGLAAMVELVDGKLML
jgi:hypothetical protein